MLFIQKPQKKKKRIKIDKELIKTLSDQGLTRKEVAEKTGYNYKTVNQVFWGLGLQPRPDHEAYIKELAEKGHTRREIAEITGKTINAIIQYVIVHGIEVPYERNPSPTHIPDEDRDKVAALVSEGWLQREIATFYGVMQNQVSKYCMKHGIPASNGRGRRRSP